MMTPARVAEELAKLKDFQRRTAEHVFRRLYVDEDSARRFLIADEVGLGKTVVVRGLIAKAIYHLQDKVARVDVVYVCSNAAIAAQNVQRLNMQTEEQTTLATRLTLLPLQMGALRKNKLNFVSFTPGTTFDLRSRGGTREERALLYRLLEKGGGLAATPLRNLLQATVSPDRWERCIEECRHGDIDSDLAQRFQTRLAGSPLRARLEEACAAFTRRKDAYAREHSELRYEVIGALRQELASTCIDALEPDLIILDEFQRFKDLLHGENDAATLARQLFGYGDARVVLLSATPYRMLSLWHETDEDHHRDFLETVRFLAEGTRVSLEQLTDSLAGLRRALVQPGPEQHERVASARHEVERILRSVMCRTERVGSTRERDAMVREIRFPSPLSAEDIQQAIAVDRVSRMLGADDPIEYWKSAPYLLSFMEGYELKRRLNDLGTSDAETLAALRANVPFTLTKHQVGTYQPIAPQNARMRVLMQETLETGNWRLLWLPPSIPYIEPSGPYAGLAPSAATKALLFSSWRVVPKAISVLLSYEAERRMLGEQATGATYEGMGRKHRPLLTFPVRARQPQGMTTLSLLYPCATLASHVDPLALALDLGAHGPASLDVFRSHIAAKVRPLVDRLVARFGATQEGAVDQRWYWALPALLDAQHHASVVDWVDDVEGMRGLFLDDTEVDETIEGAEDEDVGGYERHVDELLRVVRGKETLGRVPDDLGEVIADFALASPGVCAVRAILRVSRLSAAWDPHVLTPAARIARGFRTLFNVPESLVLLRGGDESKPYWRRVLEYCVDGNLQAVLDEYAHLLVGSEGCIGAAGPVIADRVSSAMLAALSPRTVNLSVDEVQLRGSRPSIEPFRVRCRYALRFGEIGDEEAGAVRRAKTTREAFNSPFRPFVLASTSVGQEGLDFHHYCHAVYHWNLPTNPVDIEQREGRVHRYKGHAIRRNIAQQHGLVALRTRWSGEGDPWERLFELAAAERPLGANELAPYWVFETDGGAKVERRVPLLPLSREVGQLELLHKQLAVYRLAFGQPRQEDLVAYLSDQGLGPEQIDEWRICLEPGVLESEL